MSSSKLQLVLFAAAAVLFTAIMVAGVAGNVMHGNYKAVPLIFVALAAALFLVWFSQRRTRKMFRDTTPDRIIAHYHATVRRIPNSDAAAAYLSALAAAVFGQFDRARNELEAVDWDKAPAMYQGNRLHALAVIALLESHDSAEALRLAESAQKLEEAGSGGSIAVLHGAIDLAAGKGDASGRVLGLTQRAAGRSAGVVPAFCAWALSVHYERLGDAGQTRRYRDRVRGAIPHFVSLQG